MNALAWMIVVCVLGGVGFLGLRAAQHGWAIPVWLAPVGFALLLLGGLTGHFPVAFGGAVLAASGIVLDVMLLEESEELEESEDSAP